VRKACEVGTFVPPTLVELRSLSELKREVFGPVLHVLRFKRGALDQLLFDIRATGYPLEFLVSELTVSHNTAAAGGNASLMSI
jgi:delta 1-pyrroline-5-carboxylate dehydrogenase